MEKNAKNKEKKIPAYLRYWGLKKNPFALAPDPEMMYMSKQHQECLLRLKFTVVSGKGGALLISENAGDGKTTLLKKFMETIKEDVGTDVKIAFLDHPTLSVNEMLAEIARQFGVEGIDVSNKINILNSMKEKLKELKDNGYKNVVIIDEGQMLANNPEMLQELRILMNLVHEGEFLLSFILSGQKPLEPAIRNMPEFWQRLPVRFFLRNLDYSDTKRLIQHRIKMAGGEPDKIFSETAYKGIYNFSEGTPRVILSIADLALVIGHSMYSKKIDFAEISQAAGDMNKGGESYHYFKYLEDETVDKLEEEKIKCPFCNSFIDKDLIYCPNCNSLVNKDEDQKMYKCDSCGMLNLEGQMFCSFCGNLLLKMCPQCGFHNPIGRRVCEGCGFIFGDGGTSKNMLKEFKHSIRTNFSEYLNISDIAHMFSHEEPLMVIKPKLTFKGFLPNFKYFDEEGKVIKGFVCSFILTTGGLSFLGKKDSFYIPFHQVEKVDSTVEKNSRFIVRIKNSDKRIVFTLPLKDSLKSQLIIILNKYLTGLKEVL